jgi:hypothetical protein
LHQRSDQATLEAEHFGSVQLIVEKLGRHGEMDRVERRDVEPRRLLLSERKLERPEVEAAIEPAGGRRMLEGVQSRPDVIVVSERGGDDGVGAVLARRVGHRSTLEIEGVVERDHCRRRVEDDDVVLDARPRWRFDDGASLRLASLAGLAPRSQLMKPLVVARSGSAPVTASCRRRNRSFNGLSECGSADDGEERHDDDVATRDAQPDSHRHGLLGKHGPPNADRARARRERWWPEEKIRSPL